MMKIEVRKARVQVVMRNKQEQVLSMSAGKLKSK